MIKTTTDNTEESEKAGPVITQPRKTRPGKRSLYNKQTGSLTVNLIFKSFLTFCTLNRLKYKEETLKESINVV